MATDDEPAGGELQIARDRRLVQRLRKDDQRAMRAFYDEYFPKLYRYAARRMKSQHEIDEVVQAALTVAARRIETYRGESTLLTWLIQICRHQISKHYKIESQQGGAIAFLDDDMLRAAVESLEAPRIDEPEWAALRSELIGCLQMALDQLPARYADALEKKYLEGFSSKEIGRQLGIGDEAAQSLLARARRAFREICGIALTLDIDFDGEANASKEGA